MPLPPYETMITTIFRDVHGVLDRIETICNSFSVCLLLFIRAN